LNIKLLQGSAATEFSCGGRFYFTVFRSLPANPEVKELLKSVHICQSYRENKSGTFLPRDASAERGDATVSRPSVRLSVRDVQVSATHRLEFSENNFTAE